MNKIERIKELVTTLNQYRHEYYNLNKSSVSDPTYDSLFDELSALEKECGYILSNSPTQSVGYEVKSKLQKVEHSIPLLSLNKTKDVSELKEFIGNHESIIMFKADGLTCELIYEAGHLKQASTRGNSTVGEDITHNALTFKNLPLTIPYKGYLKLAGESIIHWNDFNKINSKLPEEEKYKTPRNLCSGSVRQLDSKICSKRYIYFYAFNLMECGEQFNTKSEQLNWLSSLGFDVIYNREIVNVDKIEYTLNALREIANECSTPIDGMVIAYNDIKYANSLSSTAHHPLHSIAFKFKMDAEETTLTNIIWQVGRTGVITPVAEFETVEIDGTEVSRASVHNLSIMQNLELGIGDRVTVIKANQIIPQIEDNLTRSNNISIPDTCPVCSYKTEIQQLNESKVLMCNNPDCPEKRLQQFVHLVERDALNIEGLSEATLETFINNGWIKTFADIYRLDRYKTQIINTDGFGIRSYEKLMQAIEKSKNAKFENFVYALGIDQIGKGSSKRLVKHFNNDIDVFCDAIANHYDLTQIEDFGEITAEAVYDYFFDIDNNNQVCELLKYVTVVKPEEKKATGFKNLKDLAFVVTGDVTTFKNRKELEELITSLNGKLNGSVSSKTNYLINNDVNSTSGKNQKAKELNVPIISEYNFNDMIGRNSF